MAEALKVGDVVEYEIVCFDGPNGTGKEIPDPGQSTFVSDNPTVMSAQDTGPQSANVTAVAAGAANLQGTTSTGVVAGFLDDQGGYQSGPLAFLVSAVATIVSAILRRKAPAGASLAKR